MIVKINCIFLPSINEDKIKSIKNTGLCLREDLQKKLISNKNERLYNI